MGTNSLGWGISRKVLTTFEASSRQVDSEYRMTVPASRVVNVGYQAPDFALPSLEGDEISLSDYRGKRLVLFIWASW